MVTSFLGLGSNLGSKSEYLTEAIRLLNEQPLIRLVKVASFYQTEPIGDVEQDLFLNTVIEIKTELKPQELLKIINDIEQQLGRTRLIHWGPRTIDIDILTYGQEVINEENLIIPHREIKNRGFVLIPLLEISPEFRFPTGEKGSEILASLIQKKGCLGVKKVL